jgi:AcrR family transcriptional regulator
MRHSVLYKTQCLTRGGGRPAGGHTEVVPKLWSDTIETHRRAVRDQTLDAVAALVAERGLASVTMSQIAERTGIGRATLYRYFPDVDAILLAWHERQVAARLSQLTEVRDGTDAADRLESVLRAYAFMLHHHEGSDLAAALHRTEHVAAARQHLHDFIRDLLAEGARSGALRADIPPDELASYCLHACPPPAPWPHQRPSPAWSPSPWTA